MTLQEILITPQFYDTFGIFVFAYLIGIGIWGLIGKPPRWIYYTLIVIGGLGVLVDTGLLLLLLFN